MTATDELRELLDERGVEWTNPNSILRDDMTSWVANGFDYDAFEVSDGTLVLSAAHQDDLTPEQAIEATLGPREQPPYDELIEALRRDWDIEASWDGLRRFWYVGLTDEGVRKRDEREATLGRGTCRITDNGPWGYPYVCSECGASFDPDVNGGELNYCPNCGRKVVGE